VVDDPHIVEPDVRHKPHSHSKSDAKRGEQEGHGGVPLSAQRLRVLQRRLQQCKYSDRQLTKLAFLPSGDIVRKLRDGTLRILPERPTIDGLLFILEIPVNQVYGH
jgi:hypothetical protein